jgi:hypothetical protein
MFYTHSSKVVKVGTIHKDTDRTDIVPVLLDLWDRSVCFFPPLAPTEFTIDTLASEGVKLFCELPGCIDFVSGVCKGAPDL